MDEKKGRGPGHNGPGKGSVTVVGIGPGGLEHLTPKAASAIASSDVVVGYTRYLELLGGLVEGKEIFATAMTGEVERCARAVELAGEGRRVAVVSSGDAGIYGMAGLVFQVASRGGAAIDIDVVAGVPAFVAASALLGSPLMHDFASISLSDLLTPWEKIGKRLEAAAGADFVIVLYNPRSRGRPRVLADALEIIRVHRTPATPVGIVRNATREGESVVVTTLGEFEKHYDAVDMLTLVIVGNSTTFAEGAFIITPRGYKDV